MIIIWQYFILLLIVPFQSSKTVNTIHVNTLKGVLSLS